MKLVDWWVSSAQLLSCLPLVSYWLSYGVLFLRTWGIRYKHLCTTLLPLEEIHRKPSCGGKLSHESLFMTPLRQKGKKKRNRREEGSRRAEQARASTPSTTLTKLRTGLEIGLLEWNDQTLYPRDFAEAIGGNFIVYRTENSSLVNEGGPKAGEPQ